MITVPQSFIDAMNSNIIELWFKFELMDKDENIIGEYSRKVSSDDIGDISVDYNRDIRRMFTLTFDNSDGEFTWGENNLIWLNNNRIKLYIGLKTKNNSVEYAPQGVFIITQPENSSKEGRATVTINGQDKTYLLTGNLGKFVMNMTINKGIDIRTAISTIAQNGGIPTSKMMLDSCTSTVPFDITFNNGDSRWTAIKELADKAIYDVYFDVNGFLRFEPKKQPENEASCWTYDISKNTLYNGGARKLKDEEVFNHIVVLGGSSQTAIARADLIIDLDDAEVDWSELSAYSIQEIGRRVWHWNGGSPDSVIDHNVQAMFRAKYELKRKIGLHEAVEFDIAPNYLHEAGDIISVVDNINGATGNYMLESFSIPIKPKLVSCVASKVVSTIIPQAYSNNVVEKYVGNGTQTVFNISYTPELALIRVFDSNGNVTSSTTKYLVTKNGVEITSGFTINKSTKTLTFTVAPASGDKIELTYRVLV